MVIVIIFCTTHPENLLHPVAGQVVIQLARDAWNNKGWQITVALILISVNGNACSSLITTSSRLVWSFAKTGGLPFGSFFGSTNEHLQVPVVAVLASGFVSISLVLLVFGPYTVLNAIFGCSIVSLNITYFLPILFMLMKARESLPEKRTFNLRQYGPAINLLALFWLALTEVLLCFPAYRPITLNSMNWTSVVFVGFIVVTILNWFVVRGNYQTPKPIFSERLHLH